MIDVRAAAETSAARGLAPALALETLLCSLLDQLRSAAKATTEDVLVHITAEEFECIVLRAPEVIAVEDVVVLSPRETEIARMVARGHTNKSIAAVLDISVWTVATHLRRIFTKLNVSSRAAMVASLSASQRRQSQG
jgi:DNA-binding CsgD family transcriptional regulator